MREGKPLPYREMRGRTLYSFYRNLVGRWLAAAVTNSENPIKRREINPRPTTKGVLRMTEYGVTQVGAVLFVRFAEGETPPLRKVT